MAEMVSKVGTGKEFGGWSEAGRTDVPGLVYTVEHC